MVGWEGLPDSRLEQKCRWSRRRWVEKKSRGQTTMGLMFYTTGNGELLGNFEQEFTLAERNSEKLSMVGLILVPLTFKKKKRGIDICLNSFFPFIFFRLEWYTII